MKCRNCGKVLPLRSVECDNCGTPTNWKEYLTKRILIIASAVLLLAAVVGLLSRCEWKPPQPGDPTDTAASSGNTTQPTGPIGEDKAAEAALEYMDHSREDVVNLECSLDDSDPGKPRYFVTYEKEPYGYELQVHALTGKVLRIYNYLLPVSSEPQPTETDPQPTETEPTESISDKEYDSRPDAVYIFVHSQDNQRHYDRYGLDASECVEGWLYVFDKETGEPTLICDETVTMFDANYEHIYYVTAQNYQTVIRCDYDGQNRLELNMGITITHLDYFGGWNGDLGLVDNYMDIVVYDFEQNSQIVIFTYHDVTNVYFSLWENGYIEFNTSTEGYYFCNLETGEMWQDPF